MKSLAGNPARAQQLRSLSSADRFAEVKPLCEGFSAGLRNEIPLFFGFHSLGNHPNSDITRKVDNGVDCRCAAGILAGAVE